MTESLFLKRREEISRTKWGNLPHWQQLDTLQFVTLRLGDSLPQQAIREIKKYQESLIIHHPLPWDAETSQQFSDLIGRYEAQLLDNGYGSCLLKEPTLRRWVSDAINHMDGQKADIYAYVIMPNHIHILLCPFPGIRLNQLIGSLKSYSSHNINKTINRTGSIWNTEFHDRMIRSLDHFNYCIEYIRRNPQFLPKTEYELYFNPTLISKITK